MNILVVGELSGYLTKVAHLFMDKGGHLNQVSTLDDAITSIRSGQSADITLVDVNQDIGSFIAKLKKEHLRTTVVGTGIGGTKKEKILKAIDAGAKEYIPLPPDVDLVTGIFDTLLERDKDFIFQDPKMKDVLTLAKKIASSDATVLITGESGTGKEVLARYIHAESGRSKKKFLSVNCAAIPDNLLESELFGHEKGAFTGAVARRIGKFEEASGGTLLLDEVTEMHPRLQAKLLRAIQEREIDRVGGDKAIKVDFRLLATSNRHIPDAIAEGTFREDLYFRLNVINLALPPLRLRPEDIEPLAQHFMHKYVEINGLDSRQFSPKALEALNAYKWPGNVRELENVVHRGVLMAEEGIIEEAHLGLLSESEQGKKMHKMVGHTLEEVEKDFILSTFAHCDKDSMRAAQLLGISLKALQSKLDAYQAVHQNHSHPHKN